MPPPQGSSGRPEDYDSEEEDRKKICSYCSKSLCAFWTVPCQHAGACKKCAMRLATGGKCKVCGALFAGWERI
ncbi:unnamed protein product [Amoebophrya sp. A25]|nr:unnamed protein product [Amoebophrya sp. A25]|eukprot:GSA25T00006157001.1